MSESFRVGDFVEVVLAKPNEPITVGMRGTVVEPYVEEWTGRVYVRVDYSGLLVYSQPKCLRKIPPSQDWVKLCELNDIPRDIAKPEYAYEWSWNRG